MVKSVRKQQKKLERKRRRQKAEKTQLARQKSLGVAHKMREASTSPILHCQVSRTLHDDGLGHIVMSRRVRPGEVAFACFLVDRYCLGVKNVFGSIVTASDYHERFYDQTNARFEFQSVDPETLYLIVQGSVDYAAQFGIRPHPDYRKYAPLLGNPDVSGRKSPVEFGQDGKPLYIRGPGDTIPEARRIIALLHESCGEGQYHYVIGGAPGEFEDLNLVEMSGIEADEELDLPHETPHPPTIARPSHNR